MRYCVYIMASKSRRLYTGVTSDLPRRVAAHRLGLTPGFATRYRIDRLVYFECTGDVRAALAREKQIKAWSRGKRVAAIERENAGWLDLSAGWGAPPPASEIPRCARDDKGGAHRPTNPAFRFSTNARTPSA